MLTTFDRLFRLMNFTGGYNKRRLRLILSTLALASFLPANFAFAEEVAAPENAEKPASANESTLNWVESEDYIFAAERIPTNRWDTPANVHVITAEEIERNHYQTIWEALSHVNGVAVEVESSLLGYIGGNVAELNGTARVLLLINGRRVHNPQVSIQQAQKADMRMIPSMKMIERIEIVKGGFSALYGSDAVGGIINVITKKGTQNETTADINTGSWKSHNYEITNQGIKGKFSWFVTLGLEKRAYYRYRADEQFGGWTYGFGRGRYALFSNGSGKGSYNKNLDDDTLSVRLDHRFDDRSSLTLTAMHRTHHFDIYNDPHFNLYNDFMLSYNFKEGTSTPSWLRYYDYYASNDNAGYVNYTYNNSRLQAVEYQNGWQIGKHKIIAGAEWHQNKLSGESGGFLHLVYSGKESDLGFYLQDTIKLGKKWIFIPGVRFDHNKDSGSNWSPKISINYRADDKTKFYGSWGRVYNPPSNVHLYSQNGNPNLTSERGHTETVGFEHNFDDNTNIMLNFFRSRMRDGVDWVVPRGYSKRTSWNSLEEIRRGWEINFNQKINDNFSYSIGYSHTAALDRVHLDGEVTDANRHTMNKRIPRQPNGWRIGLNYSDGPFKANLMSIITAGLSIEELGSYALRSHTCAVFDFNTSYDINDKATIYARATNFTNQDYVRHYSAGGGQYGRFYQIGATFKF